MLCVKKVQKHSKSGPTQKYRLEGNVSFLTSVLGASNENVLLIVFPLASREIIVVTKNKIYQVFRYVTPCTLLCKRQRFGGDC